MSSRRRISSAVDIGSEQNIAIPVNAPCTKRRRIDSQPSLTTFASGNEATSVSARRSVFDRIDNQDSKLQKDMQFQTEQIMLEEQIKQREKRKAEDEAATALFFQMEATDAQRALEVQEEANQKAIYKISWLKMVFNNNKFRTV